MALRFKPSGFFLKGKVRQNIIKQHTHMMYVVCMLFVFCLTLPLRKNLLHVVSKRESNKIYFEIIYSLNLGKITSSFLNLIPEWVV